MKRNKVPPILLIIYKRPDLTEKVIASLRMVKPSELFVVADGPKNEKDKVTCNQTRRVLETIDWKCKVHKNFSVKNMGLRKRVSSGISWFFNNVDCGIILEDDCISDPTFFRFCAELLDKYADDTRVMVITGDNFQQGISRTRYSYYFSHYPHCWGWATWRRAWENYDDKMVNWQEIKKGSWLKDILGNKLAAMYWARIFDLCYENKINSWAYRWTYSCWINSGLSVIPNCNLVTNIGSGENATHTRRKGQSLSVSRGRMKFPLRYPPYIIRDKKADDFTSLTRFLSPMVIAGLIYRKVFGYKNYDE